ncbi:MAG: ABC transporter ATP-binding protein, partial [Pseudomonadota bacterium]
LSTVSLLPDTAQTTGKVLFRGEVLTGAPEETLRRIRGNDISFIFQEPMTSLNPLHTIEKQIGESLGLHQGLTGAAARTRTLELLDQVGIRDAESRLDAWPHQLSGGQRQRVMIAMALANRPKLLVADEPTTALDVTIQAQIIELVKELRQKLGMAIIWITHDLGVVARLCQDVAVMYAGEIVEDGPAHRMLHQPLH